MPTPLQWAAHPTPVRLRYGYHLYPDANGVWLIATPDDRFIRLRVPPEQIAALLPVLDGHVAPCNLLQDAHAAPLIAVLEQFGKQDLLEAVMEPEGRKLPSGTALIIGANPLAVLVHDLLVQAGVHAQHEPRPVLPTTTSDILVSCADWLPDTHWLQLDAWCRAHDVAWHTCYAEGTRFYLGPLFVPGQAPSYSDARARRRAAAPFHDELLACWRYLEGVRVLPVRWPNQGGLAVLAGALVADVLAVLMQHHPPSLGYQRAFDPEDGTWQHHPVLPLPHPLMIEQGAV
ncbi:MAG: hypothetical protein HC828_00495 [Blastochloris sp.]|nr:hypothetical protein [Blastochloris sp.]